MIMGRTATAALLVVVVNCATWWLGLAQKRLDVEMTQVPNAKDTGALCLDGSFPAYHMHPGFDSGAKNWILQFEGGAWCDDMRSCRERAPTRRGSTKFMNKYAPFNGILSNDPAMNPDFYNWNRVKLRYCDGGSFMGDAQVDDGGSPLYFKGQKIWEAIVADLLPKGLDQAEKALLSGSSAGGLSALLHCDGFAQMLPKTTTLKCMSDAGYFMDIPDISSSNTMRTSFENLVTVQGAEKNLNPNCVKSIENPKLCFFPQHLLKFITTPVFILNAAYDEYQFKHTLVPPSADPKGLWARCKKDVKACDPSQINILQGLRRDMVSSLSSFLKLSAKGGAYINSCFTHGQSELQGAWYGTNSPKINNKTVAQTVGDWYFERQVAKEIDCEYPCDTTCFNPPQPDQA